uniref:Uncharacterized protein n=1 Tax=Rhizophora mucronata TaxID=61149 RepID=A0A2P2Q4G6_RHIMU
MFSEKLKPLVFHYQLDEW